MLAMNDDDAKGLLLAIAAVGAAIYLHRRGIRPLGGPRPTTRGNTGGSTAGAAGDPARPGNFPYGE